MRESDKHAFTQQLSIFLFFFCLPIFFFFFFLYHLSSFFCMYSWGDLLWLGSTEVAVPAWLRYYMMDIMLIVHNTSSQKKTATITLPRKISSSGLEPVVLCDAIFRFVAIVFTFFLSLSYG